MFSWFHWQTLALGGLLLSNVFSFFTNGNLWFVFFVGIISVCCCILYIHINANYVYHLYVILTMVHLFVCAVSPIRKKRLSIRMHIFWCMFCVPFLLCVMFALISLGHISDFLYPLNVKNDAWLCKIDVHFWICLSSIIRLQCAPKGAIVFACFGTNRHSL